MPLEDYREFIHLCRLCGNCRQAGTSYLPICPAGERFGLDEYYSRGRAVIAQSLLDGRLAWSHPLDEIIFRCTMCAGCVEQCPVSYKDYILKVFGALKEECVERSLISPSVKKFFENIYSYSNPWRELRDKRGEWAEGTGVRRYQPGDEFLYYVGCIGSYDTRGNKIAQALGEVLLCSGLSFGILGSQENCDGNEVNLLGEKGLFELLTLENIKKFKELGVKKIVTLSPHAYNAMKNDYPQYGGNFEVKHYVQLLRDLIRSGEINVSRGFSARVTYHDSCFLGRHNEEYDAPREVLQSIPGIELVEMARNRENSFCCGGGQGNFYLDLLHGGENSPGRIRIREAYETGAEVLAVACPACMTMFDDAVKMEGLDEKLTVKDVSEIVKEALSGEYETRSFPLS